MIGETLEQHCEQEFNKIRSAAFPNAYFEKDNDSKTGIIYKGSEFEQMKIEDIIDKSVFKIYITPFLISTFGF